MLKAPLCDFCHTAFFISFVQSHHYMNICNDKKFIKTWVVLPSSGCVANWILKCSIADLLLRDLQELPGAGGKFLG